MKVLNLCLSDIDIIRNILLISGIILLTISMILKKLYCDRLGNWRNNIVKIVVMLLVIIGGICSAIGIWLAITPFIA